MTPMMMSAIGVMSASSAKAAWYPEPVTWGMTRAKMKTMKTSPMMPRMIDFFLSSAAVGGAAGLSVVPAGGAAGVSGPSLTVPPCRLRP